MYPLSTCCCHPVDHPCLRILLQVPESARLSLGSPRPRHLSGVCSLASRTMPLTCIFWEIAAATVDTRAWRRRCEQHDIDSTSCTDQVAGLLYSSVQESCVRSVSDLWKKQCCIRGLFALGCDFEDDSHLDHGIAAYSDRRPKPPPPHGGVPVAGAPFWLSGCAVGSDWRPHADLALL